MLFSRMLFFALFLMTTASVTLKQDKEDLPRVLETCDDESDCPVNSFCARRGCDGLICMCNIGYQPSEDFAECLKVVELYRSCADEKTRCRGPFTFCDKRTKTCHCMDGHIPANDNIRCKKLPRYGLSYAMLGEDCQKDVVVCQDSNQQVCSSDTSKCTCREGLKPASSIDLNAEPFILDECRPADFNLEIELKECKRTVIIGIALIGQYCITDNNCPDNSKCKQIGCKKKQCRCVTGMAPTRNMEKCKPGVMLHHLCDDSVVCLGPSIACIQGKCKCSRGSIEAVNNQCKSAPPIPGRIEFAALGEECNDGTKGNVIKLCESTMCTGGVCICPPTMREMTPAEMLNNPFKFPPCIAIEELTEELTAAEYEFRCVTLPNQMADLNNLNRMGVKPGVTARWAEEPQASSYAVREDNLKPSDEEFDESQTIEASAPDANNSADILGILMGSKGNNSLTADEIAEEISSLNESLSAGFANVSMGLNSKNASLAFEGDHNLTALNETLKFLLTNDFDATDFNESFDAGSFNESIDSWNDTLNILSLNGSLDADIANSSLDVNFSNESNGVNMFNSSLNLDISNSSLDIESSSKSLHLEFSNSSLSNSSFDEMALNNSLDFSSSNSSSLNDSLDFSSSNSSSLNDSLDFGSSNSSSLNDNLDFVSSNSSNGEEISNSSLSGNVSNSHVDVDISNSSLSNEALNISIDLNSSNESLALNMSAGDEVSEDDLEMANDGDFEVKINDLDLANKSQTARGLAENTLNGSSSLLNTTEDFDMETLSNASSLNGSVDVDTVNGSLESLSEEHDVMSSNETIGEESMNGTFANGTAEELADLSDNENATVVENITMASNKGLAANSSEVTATNSSLSSSTGISHSENSTGNLSNEGGVEETLQEEIPDLGLAVSDDGSHFVGSSGDGIEPVTYNDEADEDVDKVEELVAKGTFNNRNLLEKCNAKDACPPLSQCLDVGCGPPICFCLYSYGPSEDRKKCILGAAPPVHCYELDTYKEIQPKQSY